MGASKDILFSKKEVTLANLAKAIAHPARIAILKKIHSSQGCFCGQLVDILPLAQATISQHLKELKKADLISGYQEGTSICYRINEKQWKKIEKMFSDFLGNEINCC